MRTITINDRLSIIIEALTRRILEAMNEKKNYKLTTMNVGVTADRWDEFVDDLIKASCSPEEAHQAIEALKDAPKQIYRDVVQQLIAETWGSKEEEKN